MILAADVGGTKTELGLFRRQGESVRRLAHARVRSREFASLEELLAWFLASRRARISAACLGVAGPVIGGRCQATNLPWVVEEQRLRRALRVSRLALLNDVEALAYGVEVLPSRSLAALSLARPTPNGTKAIIAAGTGLGEAALMWDGRRYRAAAAEGGHADFAPRNELEVELWRYLQAQFGHVSYERVLSGPGKVAVYAFLKATGRGIEPAWLAKQLAGRDPSPVISELGLSGRSALCAKALDLFVSLYGAEAGNLALKYLATGGVYVGGGIAPTILPKLKDGTFLRAFREKGRLQPFLSRIPVWVILEEEAALLGAAAYGVRILSSAA